MVIFALFIIAMAVPFIVSCSCNVLEEALLHLLAMLCRPAERVCDQRTHFGIEAREARNATLIVHSETPVGSHICQIIFK